MQRELQDPYEYEVDLRDYIKVIWNQKWLIIAVTVLAVLLAGGYSLRQPATYETRSTLMMTPRVSEQLVEKEGGLSSVRLPTLAYKRAALASDLLEQIVTELELTDADGELISASSLRNRLEITLEDTDAPEGEFPVVTLTVRGREPEKIKQIANTWAQLFQQRTTEIFASETVRTFQFISERFREVEQDLNSLEEEKQRYKEENPLTSMEVQLAYLEEAHPEVLSELRQKRGELARKQARLTELESEFESFRPLESIEIEEQKSQFRTLLSRLEDKRRELYQKELKFPHLQEVLEEEDQFLELQRAPSTEAFWSLVGTDLSQEQLADLPDLTVREEVENQLYFSLRSELNQTKVDIRTLQEEIPRIEEELGRTRKTIKEALDRIKVTDSQRESYRDKVWQEMSNLRTEVITLENEVSSLEETATKLESEIKDKEAQIDQVQLKLDQYDRDMNRLKDSYKALSDNLEEARISKEEEETSVRIMEEAVAPERPLATNTKQNVAVAGVLGLFLGTLGAFFRNYMKEYEQEEEVEEENNSEE
ncbi:hypothetical protein KGY77_11460 [Candidatus Bipolaricaulota bacterium]|nr:hypothetical protein [Candidatus Bipolaricaulota bacterium]